MKKTLFSILLGIFLSACSNGRVEQPKVLTYASNTRNYERIVEVTDVEYTDTATILTFFFKERLMPGSISIMPQAYLSDEQDRHYKAMFMVEHQLGEYFFSGEDGVTFHVGFEPLPAGTQIFDMKEGEKYSSFQFMGVHAPSYKPAKPQYSNSELQEAAQIRRGIFWKGGVTLRGSIQGYDRSQNYQTYKMIYNDYMADDNKTVAIEIDPSGHFEISLDVNQIIGAAVIDHKGNWHEFIAQPGDTLDVLFLEDGTTRYSLSDGRPYLLENYNRLCQNIRITDNWLFQFDKSLNLSKALGYAREWKTLGLEYVDYIAAKYNFTAFEYEYARAMIEDQVLNAYLDYRMDIQQGLFAAGMPVRNSKGFIGKMVSRYSERKLTDPEALKFISGFPSNDSLMLVLPVKWSIYNRYKYDLPFFSSAVSIDDADVDMDKVSKCAMEYYLTDSTHLANDKKLFGLDEPSLLGKICVMQDIKNHLDTLNAYVSLEGNSNPDIVLTAYLSKMKELLNDANLEAQTDRLYQDFLRTKAPYWSLPECREKEVLSKILAKYPGKYVYLDFWSTGCGPCILGIKDLFNNNRQLMTGNHDNFVMVFITDDPVQAYEPFRKEWLVGAQSYRVSKDDYNAMAGLFNFSAIPHHELITPDGLAVTAVPDMLTVNPDNPEGK